MMSAKQSPLHPTLMNGIKQPYSSTNITKKNENKEYLMHALGLATKPKKLLVAVVLTKDIALLDEEERALLGAMKEALSTVPFVSPVFVLPKLTKEAKIFVEDFPCMEVSHDVLLNVELLSGADAFLFVEKNLSTPAETMSRILSFGGIVISLKQPSLPDFLKQYNPLSEQGNAFLFTGYSAWEAFAAVMAVYNVFQFPYDWNTLRKIAMATDTSSLSFHQ